MWHIVGGHWFFYCFFLFLIYPFFHHCLSIVFPLFVHCVFIVLEMFIFRDTMRKWEIKNQKIKKWDTMRENEKIRHTIKNENMREWDTMFRFWSFPTGQGPDFFNSWCLSIWRLYFDFKSMGNQWKNSVD